MWETILDATLRRLIRAGQLDVTLPDGREVSYDSGLPLIPRPGEAARPVHIRLMDKHVVADIVRAPQVGFAEAYMDGRAVIEGDDLVGVLALFAANIAKGRVGMFHHVQALGLARKRLLQRNPRAASRRNVKAHYDLSSDLYALFLDADRQYSCAYFDGPGRTLEEAQESKKALIARKLLLRPGMRVLDIGCGWGGMALTLARDHGARVTGITLSKEQHALATKRVADAGLSDRIDIRLQDYRDVPGTFDRVVSVGMFEHVGQPNYGTYFAKVRDLMVPDGVALIHTIGRTEPPDVSSPFIQKYIFPGGYIPALSEIAVPVERAGLQLLDLEVWRMHYAETCRRWLERFEDRIEEARALYDERFCRMWRFYLCGSEMAFRHTRQAVFQLQLGRHLGAAPITRDYLHGGAAVTEADIAVRPD